MVRAIFKGLLVLTVSFQLANSEGKDITITQGGFYKCVGEMTAEEIENKDFFMNAFNIKNLFLDAQSSGFKCKISGCSKANILINQQDDGLLISEDTGFVSSDGCVMMIEHVVPRGFISKAISFAEKQGFDEGKTTSIQEYGDVSLTVITNNNGILDYKKTCQIKIKGISSQQWR